MINDVLKILILNWTDDNINVIKEAIIKKTPRCVFVIPSSIEDFYKKINWINPDIAIADQTSDSTSVVEEAVSFLRQKSPLLPIIHLDITKDKKIENGNETQLKENYKKYFKSISLLSDHIDDLLEATKEERNTKLLKENNLLENKKLIFKSITLLEQSEDFDQKESVQSSLEKLKENLHSHQLLK